MPLPSLATLPISPAHVLSPVSSEGCSRPTKEVSLLGKGEEGLLLLEVVPC